MEASGSAWSALPELHGVSHAIAPLLPNRRRVSVLQKLKWPASVCAAAGAYLVWQGWNDRELYTRLDAAGRVVEGTIDSGESKSGRRSSKSYSFDVSYTTEAGQLQSRSFEVTKGFFERCVSGDQIVHDQVQVKYDPEDPQRAILVGGSKDQRGMLPVGGAMAGAGILLAGFLFTRRRADASGDQAPS